MTKDMTSGTPAKVILLFSVPLLLGNIIQQLYTVADAIMVGQILGVNALGAVGSTGSLLFLMFGFVGGMTSGLTIITAQRFGAKDEQGLRNNFAASILISVTVSVVLTVIIIPLSGTILELMQTPPEIIDDARIYLVVVLSGIIISMLNGLFGGVIRALGNSKTPLIFLGISGLISIALNFGFILWLGVAGAALSTVISQAISGILCYIYIYRKIPMLRLGKGDWKINANGIKEHLQMAFPIGFQLSIVGVGVIALQYVFNQLGATAVAAYSAALRLENSIAMQPMIAFGVAISTFVAQNYGAGKFDRIRKGVVQASIITSIYSIGIGIVYFIFGFRLSGLFMGAGNEDVQTLVQTYLRISTPFYIFVALLIIYRLSLQSLGKKVMPMLSGVIEVIVRVVIAIIPVSIVGFAGASWANPLSWIASSLPLMVAFFALTRSEVKLRL